MIVGKRGQISLKEGRKLLILHSLLVSMKLPTKTLSGIMMTSFLVQGNLFWVPELVPELTGSSH